MARISCSVWGVKLASSRSDTFSRLSLMSRVPAGKHALAHLPQTAPLLALVVEMRSEVWSNVAEMWSRCMSICEPGNSGASAVHPISKPPTCSSPQCTHMVH